MKGQYLFFIFIFSILSVQATKVRYGVSMYSDKSHYVADPEYKKGRSFFGIFDGYGSIDIVDYATKHFPRIMQESTIRGRARLQEAFTHIEEKITDKDLLAAAVVRVMKDVLYLGRVGDARALLLSGTLSEIKIDHTSNQPDGKPEVLKLPIEKGSLLVLATDGYWSKVSKENTVRFIQALFGNDPGTAEITIEDEYAGEPKLYTMARSLNQIAFNQKADNSTVMVVYFE